MAGERVPAQPREPRMRAQVRCGEFRVGLSVGTTSDGQHFVEVRGIDCDLEGEQPGQYFPVPRGQFRVGGPLDDEGRDGERAAVLAAVAEVERRMDEEGPDHGDLLVRAVLGDGEEVVGNPVNWGGGRLLLECQVGETGLVDREVLGATAREVEVVEA